MIRLASAGITSASKLVTDSDPATPTSSTTPTTSAKSDSRDNDLVNAISRSGSKKEALGGPLIYTVVLFLATLLGFRESPIGVVAVCQMAAGDGLADIVGRRYGTVKWPFSASKSYAGSLAFVVGAFGASVGVLSLLSATGCLTLSVGSYLPQLVLISIVCALVELVPIGDDNVTVPVAGAILTALLLR
jgi:phytol kinase